MSSTVEVWFHGLVLWWLTAPGPYAVVPDFTAATNAHHATLRIVSLQYEGGNCPTGFTGDGSCTISLTQARKPGGVSMKFAAGASRMVSREPFCPIPKLQDAGTPLVLRPEFTPPAGDRNAGWVQFEGGTLTPYSPCGNDDCARSVFWTPDAQEITLTLGNLSNRDEPLVIPLPADSIVTVSNERPERSDGRRANADEEHHHAAAVADWCLYFQMVTNDAATAISCPGRPEVPICPGMRCNGAETTIACSNSQYP